MKKVVPAILWAVAMSAQTPQTTPPAASAETGEKAPPEVDAALRARVTQFYQLEVDGKFNQALQLVAADTKDLYVGFGKPNIRNFEILGITYSDNFTKARVMMLASRLLPVEGFVGNPVMSKMPSRWKIEDGQWCWYVDPKTDLPPAPFGSMGPPPGAMAGGGFPTGGGPRTPPPMPANIPGPNKLTVDKSELKLNSTAASSDQAAIFNPAPWQISIAVLDPKVPGLTVKLDRAILKAREKAILSVESSGPLEKPKNPVTVVVTVQRTNQMIPIKVTFN